MSYLDQSSSEYEKNKSNTTQEINDKVNNLGFDLLNKKKEEKDLLPIEAGVLSNLGSKSYFF
jgi:hypothetical protein